MSEVESHSETDRPARRRGKTKPALLAAGLKLLSERHVDSLSIDEIVGAAQVAKGSFFYHFADKHSFALEIAGEVRAEIEREVGQVNRGVEDPPLRIARGVCRFVRFAVDHPEKASIILRLDRQSLDPGHAMNAGLRADLELGVRRGRLDCPDLDAAIMCFLAVTNAMMRQVLADLPPLAAVREMFVLVMLIALRGLGVAPADAESLLRATADDLLAD